MPKILIYSKIQNLFETDLKFNRHQFEIYSKLIQHYFSDSNWFKSIPNLFGLIVLCYILSPHISYLMSITWLLIYKCNTRCYVDGCESNGTEFSPEWLNNTVPWDESSMRWSQCDIYNHTWNSVEECIQGDIDNEDPIRCQNWVYDTTVFSSTIFTTVLQLKRLAKKKLS